MSTRGLRDWAIALLQVCVIGALVALVVPAWLTLAAVAAILLWPHQNAPTAAPSSALAGDVSTR